MADDDIRMLPRFDAPPGGALTPEMRRAYENAGVLILDDFVPADACDALRARALELVEGFDPQSERSVFSTTRREQSSDDYFISSGGEIRFFLEEGALDKSGRLRQPKAQSLNKIGHAMHDRDAVFSAFSRTPELARLVAELGVAEPLIVQSMYIFKPPYIGGEVVCHQDSTFIHTEPESCVGFWFAIEDATVENGCLYYIPGRHKGSLRERYVRDAEGTLSTITLDETPFDEDRRLPLEARKGTLAVFHGRAPHLSGPNRSGRSRHAYTLHVVDGNTRWPPENWLQRAPEFPFRGF